MSTVYALVLWVTTVGFDPHGVRVARPGGTITLGTYASLRECYDAARSMRLSVETYSCLPLLR